MVQEKNQTKPRYFALPLKVLQRKDAAQRGTDVREGETGEGGVEHKTERNTRGVPGSDTLQGTYFHSIFLSREVNVSLHFPGQGTAHVTLI